MTMAPFDELFPDLARSESRAITVTRHGALAARFVPAARGVLHRATLRLPARAAPDLARGGQTPGRDPQLRLPASEASVRGRGPALHRPDQPAERSRRGAPRLRREHAGHGPRVRRAPGAALRPVEGGRRRSQRTPTTARFEATFTTTRTSGRRSRSRRPFGGRARRRARTIDARAGAGGASGVLSFVSRMALSSWRRPTVQWAFAPAGVAVRGDWRTAALRAKANRMYRAPASAHRCRRVHGRGPAVLQAADGATGAGGSLAARAVYHCRSCRGGDRPPDQGSTAGGPCCRRDQFCGSARGLRRCLDARAALHGGLRAGARPHLERGARGGEADARPSGRSERASASPACRRGGAICDAHLVVGGARAGVGDPGGRGCVGLARARHALTFQFDAPSDRGQAPLARSASGDSSALRDYVGRPPGSRAQPRARRGARRRRHATDAPPLFTRPSGRYPRALRALGARPRIGG